LVLNNYIVKEHKESKLHYNPSSEHLPLSAYKEKLNKITNKSNNRYCDSAERSFWAIENERGNNQHSFSQSKFSPQLDNTKLNSTIDLDKVSRPGEYKYEIEDAAEFFNHKQNHRIFNEASNFIGNISFWKVFEKTLEQNSLLKNFNSKASLNK